MKIFGKNKKEVKNQEGYQPEGNTIDPTNPPQGGSGVPGKSLAEIKGKTVVEDVKVERYNIDASIDLASKAGYLHVDPVGDGEWVRFEDLRQHLTQEQLEEIFRNV